jgi:LPPG:FO 2-phospho-L-lactate transferase
MMESLGHEPTAVGIARMYGTLIDTFVLDQADAELAPQIEKLGLRAVVRDTVMVDPSRRQEVGRQVLEAVLTR